MARDVVDLTPIESRDELVAWFAEGAKPKAQWRIGTEHEKFAFTHDTHEPVPYEGRRSIRSLLVGMQHLLGWEPITDGPNIIGLADVTGGGAISLEPGGQFELSGAPLETVHQTASELTAHLAQLREIARPLGIGFLGLGMSPKWTRAQTPVMPKSRYKIMTAYMPKVGRYGLDMMYRTCTVQTNLDFSSEADMVKKLRVSLALQPVATALFANSPFTEGKPNGYLSFRSEVWRDTDKRAPACCRSRSRTAWASSATSITRSTCRCISSSARTNTSTCPACRSAICCRQAAGPRQSARHAVGLGEPRLDDFPRGAAQALSRNARRRCRAVAAAAGAAGVLGRHPVRRCRARCRVGSGEGLERGGAADSCATMCRAAALRRRSAAARMLDLARECLALSEAGLKRRKYLDSEGRDETRYLAPLQEFVARGITPAEELLEKYHGPWGGSVEPVFNEYAY